jgi:hypothetical protein
MAMTPDTTAATPARFARIPIFTPAEHPSLLEAFRRPHAKQNAARQPALQIAAGQFN